MVKKLKELISILILQETVFNESCFYFAVKNVIFLNELENLSNEPVKKISFAEKIHAFAFNKSILIVSLQNNECFFNDFNKNMDP
jgi:hypothetical protein